MICDSLDFQMCYCCGAAEDYCNSSPSTDAFPQKCEQWGDDWYWGEW